MVQYFPGVIRVERMMVIGCPGSGKSTLSRLMAKKTGFPLVHLDQLFWNSGWQEKSREEFDSILTEELQKDRWIIDGNYSRTISMRLERADTVVFMDYPSVVCAYRVLKRVITRYGESRSDMGENCPERFDMSFLKYVWHFRKTERPKLISRLSEAEGKHIIDIKNEKDRKAFLKKLEDKACK